MRTLSLFGSAFVMLCLTACSGKDKKDGDKGTTDGPKAQTNAEKIIGKWKVVKSKEDTSMIEFNAGGTGAAWESEKSKKPEKLTYKVDGDKLTVTLEGDDPKTATIKIFTDKKLVLEEPQFGEREFEKLP